jgi:protein-S-isoprenylcysteine O-methyltransferase Ste14
MPVSPLPSILGRINLTHWVILPLFFVLIGIRSTARAEEIVLVEIFGEKYEPYQLKVGMLFPKLGKK